MKKYPSAIMTVLAAMIVSLGSCLKKENDNPPNLGDFDPQLPVNMSIGQLKSRMPASGAPTRIDSAWTIYGIVTADDRSGNFYKQITIQDSSGGIAVLINANSLYTKYPIGRKVYVKLQGLYYGFYGGLPQIGILDNGEVGDIPGQGVDNFIIRANFPNVIKSDTVAFSNLLVVNTAYLNRLVTIKDVEFLDNELGKTFADNPTTSSSSGADRLIQPCPKNGTINVRSSNYANFREAPLPGGKGVITGIYTVYNGKPQLLIRDTNDVNFAGLRCDGGSGNSRLLLDETFSDLSEWNAQNVAGAQVWTITTQFGNPKPSAIMNGYANGANNANEDWLITKQLDLTGYNTITLQFETASKFNGPQLQCYISTDYNGTGLPASASWTLLPATYDQSNNFQFTPSGIINLSSYKNQKVHVAFKYTSTTAGSATWELDNVKVAAE